MNDTSIIGISKAIALISKTRHTYRNYAQWVYDELLESIELLIGAPAMVTVREYASIHDEDEAAALLENLIAQMLEHNA